MTALLTEFGKKIAERWLSALMLPGLLYTSAAVGAYLLGWRHALDPVHLASGLNRVGVALSHQPARIIVAVVTALLFAAAVGLAVQGVAGVAHRVYVMRYPLWWLLRRRRRARAAVAHRNPRPPVRYLPRCATPIGDRFRLIGERVDAQYGLDATLAWPRLWLLLPEVARTAVQTAHDQYRAATALTSWGTFYIGLGIVWPPALVAGVVAATIGYRRAIAAAAVLADLIEATIDTQQQTLATIAGITLPHGRITRAEGLRINDVLNKRA